MTSKDRAFLDSLLGRLQSQVPFPLGGDFESGEITIDNFPQISDQEKWVLQGLFEDAYRFCERNDIEVRAIRFRDALGRVVSEVRIAHA